MGLYKRGEVWWVDVTDNGKRVRRPIGRCSKKKAEQIYHKFLGEIADLKWFERLPAEDKTFKEMMTRYMNEHSKIRKRSWSRDETSLLHLLPALGDLTIIKITPDLISRYKSGRLKEGAKPATLNKELALMKHAFNLALKEWEWVRENPVSRVKMEKENNSRDRVLSYEEEERLIAVCPPWLKEIVIFALNTGAREGEILGLTWNQVNLSEKVVTINQEKTMQNKSIPLIPITFDLLKSKSKVRYLHLDLVFPTENGTRITASNLGRGFRRALKRVEINNFKFHDLRHTFASRLAQGGVDLYLIQKLLGHKDPRMTQRYAHYNLQSLREGIGVLEKLRLRNEIGRSTSQIGHSEGI